jgi:DMSO/TMAO reductase YedYZ molybdopterin-dependent catalytic subunit
MTLGGIMNFIKSWIQTNLSRRGFILMAILGLYRLAFKSTAWARAEYVQAKEFLIRSIEGTRKVDLKAWHLKIEGLVEKPISLSFAEIKTLPQKIQNKNFICVEGWGLDNQKWEGVHLKEIFSKVNISPKAKFITFHATGGKYKDSLSIKEALEPDTMLAYRVNGKDLPPENGFPLRLIIPRMYAYKGVKWVEKIVFTEKQEVGYWEQRGYSVDGSIPGLKS